MLTKRLCACVLLTAASLIGLCTAATSVPSIETDGDAIILRVPSGSSVSVSYGGGEPQRVVTMDVLQDMLDDVKNDQIGANEALAKRISTLEDTTASKSAAEELKKEIGAVLAAVSVLEDGDSEQAKCHAKRQLYDAATKTCVPSLSVNCGDHIGKALGRNRDNVECAGKHFYGDTCTSKCAAGYQGLGAEFSCSISGVWELVGKATQCTDIDECAYNDGGCDTKSGAACVNTEGSSSCECGSGLELTAADDTKCQATPFSAQVFAYVPYDYGCLVDRGFKYKSMSGYPNHGDMCRANDGHWTPPKGCKRTSSGGAPYSLMADGSDKPCRVGGKHSSTWKVPAGVTSVKITALGSGGQQSCEGFAGGAGAWVQATVGVQPGEVLRLEAGGPGNGLGIPGPGVAGHPTQQCKTFGGGLVGVFRGGNVSQATALVVAGSGGSGGTAMCSHGGDGGEVGADAACFTTQSVGRGGSAKAGGKGGGVDVKVGGAKGTPGSALMGGRAGVYGQAGGAGWFGGGGGGNHPTVGGGGGGGGSSFVAGGASGVVFRSARGAASDHGGSIIIEYD